MGALGERHHENATSTHSRGFRARKNAAASTLSRSDGMSERDRIVAEIGDVGER